MTISDTTKIAEISSKKPEEKLKKNASEYSLIFDAVSNRSRLFENPDNK